MNNPISKNLFLLTYTTIALVVAPEIVANNQQFSQAEDLSSMKRDLTISPQTTSTSRSVLTPDQELEVRKAQEETVKLRKEFNKRTKPVFYGDPKILGRASSINDIYRPGVFYVNLDKGSGIPGTDGHAAMVYSTTQTIEAWGNQGSNNGVRFWPNDWDFGAYTHFVARTVIGTTTTQDKQAADRAKLQIGKPYNFNLYSIDQDGSYYCSQLVYRQFKILFQIDLNDVTGSPVPPIDLVKTEKAYNIYGK